MQNEQDLIRKYHTFLRLEKGLSFNSIEAYLSDLDKLLVFVRDEQLTIETVTYAHLQQFVAGLHDIGIHPRSQARIISGIKSFYRFLVVDDYLQLDPTELLESPKIGVKLPEVLTLEEVNALIASIDQIGRASCRERVLRLV